jgi:hypothetical protein
VLSSVYCLPADLLGEGAARVVGTILERAGVPGPPSLRARPVPAPASTQPHKSYSPHISHRSHPFLTWLDSYGVDVSAMSPQLHERGIHAL